MKIVMAMVMSVDGKITRGDDPYIHSWTSKEDRAHFSRLINDSNLIVMGSATYEAAKEMMHLSTERLRIVMTQNPEKYKDSVMEDALEFSSEKPAELVERLSAKGYTEMLLAGGATINSLFLKEQLVDELILTIEPKMFGAGTSIVAPQLLDIQLKLAAVEKLNSQGTLLLRYTIVKNS